VNPLFMHGRDAATAFSLWAGCDLRNTERHIRTVWRYERRGLLNPASRWGNGVAAFVMGARAGAIHVS